MSLKATYSQFHWSTGDPETRGPRTICPPPCNCSPVIPLKLMPGIQNYNYLNFSFQCPLQFSVNISTPKSLLYQKEMKSMKGCRFCFTQENHTLAQLLNYMKLGLKLPP